MKKLFVLLIFSLLIYVPCHAQLFGTKYPVEKCNIALKINASTDGAGGDIVVQFNHAFALRAGANYLSVPYSFNYNEDEISLNTDFRYNAGNVSAYFDLYIIKWLYLTAGVGTTFFGAQAYGVPAEDMPYGDITLPKEMLGSMDLKLSPGVKVTPYLGLGFGRTISAAKRVAFSFEIGGSYIGAPQIAVTSTNMLAPNETPEHIAELNQIVSRYKILPTIKLGLSITLFKGKK